MTELYNATKTALHKQVQQAYNAVMPVPVQSEYREKGVITPEEFVAAGDLLTVKFPAWQWAAGDPAKAVKYLPENKQFLVTKNVPCYQRARSLECSSAPDTLMEGDWVAPAAGTAAANKAGVRDEEIPEIPGGSSSSSTTTTAASTGAAASSASAAAAAAAADDDDDDDDIPDMETFSGEALAADVAALEVGDNILKTRTYDLSITYDFYYRTPKVWLFGYDERRQPLKPQEVFQDISGDHAKKTVTIDSHPHLGYQCAFIHPCQHSSVMKKLIDRQVMAGKEPRLDQYMVLFLKFIASVIPTIEYDFTAAFES